MARTGVVALMVVVGMLFAYGCAQQGKAPPSEREQKEQIPSTARIVCLRADHGASPLPKSTEALNGNALTRVLTPKVAARPDGVHIQVANRLGKSTLYHVDDFGFRIPKGISNHLEDSPPGKVGGYCRPTVSYRYSRYTYFEIVAGESDYKSPELECNKGAKPAGGYPADAVVPREVPKGKKFHPIEHVREEYSGKLKEGDVVETAGYPDPEEPYPRVVRVVRNGKVVATYGYYEDGGEAWRTYCKGQF